MRASGKQRLPSRRAPAGGGTPEGKAPPVQDERRPGATQEPLAGSRSDPGLVVLGIQRPGPSLPIPSKIPPRPQLLADSNLPAGSPWEEPLGRGRCALTLLALKVFQPGAKLLHQSLNTRALGEKRNTHQFTAKVQKVRYLYNFVFIQKCCVFHVSKELHHQYLHELKSLQTIGLWIQFGKCIHQVYSLVLTYKM